MRVKNNNFKVTPDILRSLQEALRDNIKPDFKEHTDAKKKHKKRKKEKSPDGSSERNQSETTV